MQNRALFRAPAIRDGLRMVPALKATVLGGFLFFPAIPPEARGSYSPEAATPEGLYREGRRLRQEGKTEAALTTWRVLIEEFPEHRRAGCAAVYMGQLQLSNKDHQGAVESFSLAAEKFGHHKYGNGVEVGGYAHFYLASAFCEIEEYVKATESLRDLVTKYPYASGHRMGDALMSLRARQWFYERLTEQGMDLSFLDKLISEQKNPENFNRLDARQLYLVAHTLKDENFTEHAIEAFKKTARKFPNETFSPYACLYAFDLQFEQRKYDDAMASARLMIERFPDAKLDKGGPLGAIGRFNIGLVHFTRREYKEAASAFQTVTSDHPMATNREGVSLSEIIAEEYREILSE